MTTTRNRGTAPIFRAFADLAALPPAERTEALMVRLEHVWDDAQAKHYVNKHGEEIPCPDGTLQLKVIQAVAVLQGMTAKPDEGEAAALGAMSDAELVREATKRLPAHQVAELADALIAQREQQIQTIETTGETPDEHQEKRPKRGRKRKADPNGGGFPQSGSEWA